MRCFLTRFLSFLTLTAVFISAAGTNQSNRKPVSSKGRWYTNHNLISEVPLSHMALDGVYIVPQRVLDQKKQVRLDYKKIVSTLLSYTNTGLLNLLADELDITNKNLLSSPGVLLDEINKRLYPENIKTSFSSRPLISRDQNGDILIKKADIFETVTVTKNNRKNNQKKSERIFTIKGNVVVYAQGSTIYAQKVVINGETRDIYAEGHVSYFDSSVIMFGKKLFLNSSDQTGYIKDVYGVLDPGSLAAELSRTVSSPDDLYEFYRENEAAAKEIRFFEGSVTRMNSREHFTVDESSVTVCPELPPHFKLHVRQFDYMGKERMMADNLVLYIHNQPFFYFPFFWQDPFSIGLNVQIGRTKREGYYVKTKLKFDAGRFKDVSFYVNLYENLGPYLRLQNKGTIKRFNYDIDLSGAYYTRSYGLYEYGNLIYSSYYKSPSDPVEKSSSFRYRILFKPTVDFLKDKTDSLLPETVSPQKTNLLSENLPQQGKDVAYSKLGISSRLRADAALYSDPVFDSSLDRPVSNFNDLLNDPAYDESIYYLRAYNKNKFNFYYNLNSPSVSMGLNGRWIFNNKEDVSLPETDLERYYYYLSSIVFPEFSMRHNGKIDPARKADEYNLDINYTVGLSYSLTSFYTDKTNREVPNEFDYYKNRLQANAGLNRSFKFTGAREDPWKILDFGYKPSLSFSQQKIWSGNSDPLNDLRNSWIKMSFNQTVFLNFPSGMTRNALNRSSAKLSMLPFASFNLRHTLNTVDTFSDRMFFKGYEYPVEKLNQNFNASMTVNQKGYGLFYIPWLDFTQKFQSSFQYTLPSYDKDDTNKEYQYGAEHIKNFNGSYRFNLTYKNPSFPAHSVSLGDSVSFIFFDKYFEEVVFHPQKNALSVKYQYSRPSGQNRFIFDFKKITAGLNWSYGIATNLHTSDSMGFNFSTEFEIADLFDFKLSLSARNQQAWRYFKKKSEKAYVEQVSFFDDLANSLGLRGVEGRQEGLFKLNSISMSLSHDLHRWYARASYTLTPKLINRARSLKGFYFDQKIELEINIKPDVNLEGLDKQFPSKEFDLTPEELKILGET